MGRRRGLGRGIHSTYVPILSCHVEVRLITYFFSTVYLQTMLTFLVLTTVMFCSG